MVHSLGTSPVVLKSWNCSHQVCRFYGSGSVIQVISCPHGYFLTVLTYLNLVHMKSTIFCFCLLVKDDFLSPLTMTNVGLMAYYIILQEKALPLVLMMCLL